MLLLYLMSVCVSGPEEVVSTELSTADPRLQGCWVLVESRCPPSARVAPGNEEENLIISGNSFVRMEQKKTTCKGTYSVQGTGEIDFYRDGNIWRRGLYQVRERTLIVNFGGVKRPTSVTENDSWHYIYKRE